MAISRRGWLCLLVLTCFAVCIYSDNKTCGDQMCPGNNQPDSNGDLPNECCSDHLTFLSGCCSESRNEYLRLIRDIVIGVSVGVGGLILILILICICCCCCVCCA